MASALPLLDKPNPLAWFGRVGSPSSAAMPHLETLQGHIEILPTLFRCVALIFFLPVLALALADLVGWAFFKLVLRPLGYASTIRFKDPEPPSMLVPASVDTTLAHSTSSADSSATSSPTSTTASLPLHEDDPPNAITHKPVRTSSSVPFPSSTHAPSDLVNQHRPSSSMSSTSSASSLETSGLMNRHRAQSVGLDGPLFGLGEGETTDDAQTPSVESDSGSEFFGGGAAALSSSSSGNRRGGPNLSFTKAKAE
ncbi:hypothetical protein JCM1840_007553 [Sporobolomyces johnsonii]